MIAMFDASQVLELLAQREYSDLSASDVLYIQNQIESGTTVEEALDRWMTLEKEYQFEQMNQNERYIPITRIVRKTVWVESDENMRIENE